MSKVAMSVQDTCGRQDLILIQDVVVTFSIINYVIVVTYKIYPNTTNEKVCLIQDFKSAFRALNDEKNTRVSGSSLEKDEMILV